MIWDNQDNDLNCNTSDSQLKNNHKSHSTLMTSNILIDEENDFQELLVNKRSNVDKMNFFSENNSLFELKNEDNDPFFFNEPIKTISSPIVNQKPAPLVATSAGSIIANISVETKTEKKKRKRPQNEV